MGQELDEITGQIVDAAYKLHLALGPGPLESVYEIVLARDLGRRGLKVERQKSLSFNYDGLHFSDCFKIDLIVESEVIVEIKSVESLAPQHAKQLLTYLRLSHLPVGFLMNFGTARLKDGLRRVVNGLAPSASPRLRVNQRALQRRALAQDEGAKRNETARHRCHAPERELSVALWPC